jgi:hypothetical protein
MGVEYMFLCFTCYEYIHIGKFVRGRFQGPFHEKRDEFMGMKPIHEWLMKHTEHSINFCSDQTRPDWYIDDAYGWTKCEPKIV